MTSAPEKLSLRKALEVRARAFWHLCHTFVPKENKYKALLAGAAVVVLGAFMFPHEPAPSEPASPSVDLSRFDMALETRFAPKGETRKLTLKSGDNLGPLLQKQGLSGAQAYKVTQAFAKIYKPQELRPGQGFTLYFEDGDLTDLTFKPNVDKTIFLERSGEDFTAREITAEFKFETISVAANIENSLYVDASRLGAPDKTIVQFANIYEYSVDFQRDIQPGDQFEMFFEVARDHNGKIIKAGDLLYTSFSPRGKQSQYWLYADDKGRENFYDAAGKTAKRKLRATPINGARLSSSYGRRKHPILGYRKMHTGVDFAAPRGTPIMAAGSGRVERANRYGGYGNYIRIAHSDGYKTAYAHLNKFARGIRAGAYVKQDQVIGYVGTTGRSTGPHLHYEVHLHGKKINPRRVSQLSGKPLAASQMADFKARRAKIETLRGRSSVVSAESDASAGSFSGQPALTP